IPELVAAADVAVLTSLKEGIPRALIEAMAVGVPVVATDVKGSREVVVDGQTGFLVPLGDTQALGGRLSQVLDSPALRADLCVRREQLVFPLALPFWLIMVGSLLGMYRADDPTRAVLTVTEDVYLYLWFVTLAHFLSRRCRLDDVATVFVAVACAVALLTYADA